MFDGPQRAIRCAMAIRNAVQALGLQVRAGLHTGECEVRGDDIGGIAVHIGARVSALSHANEVLVSSTLRDLVIGSGLEFEERGAHALKGLPGEWHLFAVASLQVRLSVTCLRVDVLQHCLGAIRSAYGEAQLGSLGHPALGSWVVTPQLRASTTTFSCTPSACWQASGPFSPPLVAIVDDDSRVGVLEELQAGQHVVGGRSKRILVNPTVVSSPINCSGAV